MSFETKHIGSIGEQLASDYLAKKGYSLIARNVYSRWGELDIIATYGTTVVFVEVKTRVGTAKGKPYEAVTYRKRQTLMRSAQYFLKTNPYPDYTYRFDVISLILSFDPVAKSYLILELNHYENITA